MQSKRDLIAMVELILELDEDVVVGVTTGAT